MLFLFAKSAHWGVLEIGDPKLGDALSASRTEERKEYERMRKERTKEFGLLVRKAA